MAKQTFFTCIYFQISFPKRELKKVSKEQNEFKNN